MGAGARATQPSDRRTWPRSMRRTMEGGIAWVWKWGGERACAFASVGKLCGPKQGMCSGKGTCSPSDTTGGGGGCKGREGNCSHLRQRALTQKRTLGVAAHSSEVTVLPLSASQSLVMPSAV